jgi:hypothetical protein
MTFVDPRRSHTARDTSFLHVELIPTRNWPKQLVRMLSSVLCDLDPRNVIRPSASSWFRTRSESRSIITMGRPASIITMGRSAWDDERHSGSAQTAGLDGGVRPDKSCIEWPTRLTPPERDHVWWAVSDRWDTIQSQRARSISGRHGRSSLRALRGSARLPIGYGCCRSDELGVLATGLGRDRVCDYRSFLCFGHTC